MSEGMDHVELENPTISLNLPPQAQENIAQAVSSIAMDGSTMDQELPIGVCKPPQSFKSCEKIDISSSVI